MINEVQKQKIAEKLKSFCEHAGSQNKAAKKIKNVSSATISQILNGKWDLIKQEMWRAIAAKIGYKEEEWALVETRDLKILTALLTDAQQFSNVFAVIGNAGTGKTVALRRFADNNKRVYLLHCCEFWNRKAFMQELLTALGRDYSGFTVGEMMNEVVKCLKSQECPLIVLDEADKLSDQVMYFFITLYNLLEDNCGIVLCATDHLEKRIKRGLKLNKKGYKEIFSRIGRKFIELTGLSSTDVATVCMANGITDREQIKSVIDDCECDLRRVKRKIHALKNAA